MRQPFATVPFALPGGSALRVLLVMLLSLMLAACGTKNAEYDETANWTAERLYQDAKAEIASGNWNQARTRLTAVEARYPFGVYAQQALVDLAYVNWRDNEPEQALATIARFQQQYPNHPGTDYILYLKGLVSFTPPSAFMAGITRQDSAERDPKGLRQSYEAFEELLKRFPDSKYAPDAKERLTWLVNTIAMNEVHVARYYYQRDAYVAAANRAQTVITDFEGAPAAEEALYLLVMSYDKLGMTDLRDDARRVLEANYPNSKFVANGYAAPPAWWNPFGIF
ncbi:Probable component of the lipoprotein assembly complex (forms a complex with YaeT, YfgL, and NlpB) [plant metagenome]|uniref:Probable component of the lipoprotein assembly complex (Forms a complex with YaeT, YfgL, and NlpB) n=1 Tax=plant metagenome TaxID=1297885 RepID=A0A484PJ01_9ZZZZ